VPEGAPFRTPLRSDALAANAQRSRQGRNRFAPRLPLRLSGPLLRPPSTVGSPVRPCLPRSVLRTPL